MAAGVLFSLAASPAVGAGDAGPRVAADGSRLRGPLKGLVRAARAGTLGASSYRGLETAQVAGGAGGAGVAGVAVSLQLAASGGEAALAALVANGADVRNRDGSSVEAYLPAAALRVLATSAGIERASTIIRPVPLGSGLGIVGEGVGLHGADTWQASGITGAGVKVGIIDGGFIGLTARLGKELPDSVHARCYREVGIYSSTAKSCEMFTDHGTAVAETIADMAPGASLYVADPFSPQDLVSSVAWMTSNGVRVINISLGFAFEGPGDTSAPPPDSIYTVVNQAVAGGALWVNAAGNSGENGWTGTWRDADHDDLLEFNGTDETNAVSLAAGDTVVVSMRWNDPWGASSNDYDLYVLGPNGDQPIASSEDTQDGDGDPVESLSFTTSSSGVYRIRIERAGGSAASKIQLLLLTSQNAPLGYRVAAGTLPSPADSPNPGLVAVGAVDFNTPGDIESYSSRGPTPDDRVKPDLVAADCTTTSVENPFCGTSASSPYVAGAAALVLQARPSLSPAGVAAWLRDHAVPLGAAPPNSTYGWGRLSLGDPPAPPAPASLAFATQPSVVVAGAPFPAVAVSIRDQDGQVVTAGSGGGLPVTLALGAGSGGGVLACSGGLTRAAVDGVATFSGCTISAPGSGVTLVASSGGLRPATSAPIEVLPVGSVATPTLSTSASAAAINWGTGVTLRATLAVPSGGVPGSVAGRSIAFQASPDRRTWHAVGSAFTSAGGVASLTYRPVTNLYYRAVFAGAADLGQAVGSSVRVTVRQTASLRPTNHDATKTLARNSTITFSATVRPARIDVPPGAVTFEIYRLVGSAWRRVASQVASPSVSGVAAISVTFNSKGSWAVRAQAAPTAVNANSFWTPMERFRVT